MIKKFGILLVLSLTSIGFVAADTLYNVTISTAPYTGQSGYLDFQLGRGPDSQSASVTVENFAGSGTLDAASIQTSGNVAGKLPGQVVITNSGVYNDYFQGFKFGGLLSFSVLFSGPAINAPNGTSVYGSPFSFGMYDSSTAPLGPTDGFGNAFLIQINTNGSTTPTIYNTAAKVTTASAVPEPGMLGLATVGLAAGLMLLRRQAR